MKIALTSFLKTSLLSRPAALFFALLPALLLPPPALAGDIHAGAEKAESCVACHGAAGNAPIADYPKLAAQNEKYLLYAMRAYQNGTRANAVMAAQSSGWSAEDIADLAAYFAAQPGDLR